MVVIRLCLGNLECFISWNFAICHFDVLEKFRDNGKQPGTPGTPGVPEPSPSYPPADNAQGGDHIYELEDEPIVSHEIISS